MGSLAQGRLESLLQGRGHSGGLSGKGFAVESGHKVFFCKKLVFCSADTASGTLLLLDPLPNQHPSSSSLSLEPELEPESQQRAESPKCSSQGTDSEPEAEQSCKSTWKEESLESSSTMRKDGKVFSQPAGVSDKTSQEEPEQQGVPAPIEDSQVEKSCPSLSSTASQSSQVIRACRGLWPGEGGTKGEMTGYCCFC